MAKVGLSLAVMVGVMLRLTRRIRNPLLMVIVAGLPLGCAASGTEFEEVETSDFTEGSGKDGAGADADASGTGGTGEDTGSPVILETVGEDGEIIACAATAYQAKLIPLNLLVQFDRSGSMWAKAAGDSKTRWEHATAALKAHIADPSSGGVAVALSFFPQDSCNIQQCTASACATPEVALGLLSSSVGSADAQETSLISAIDVTGPVNQAPGPTNPGTPIHPALAGALQWATDVQADNPEGRTGVILVTDGLPDGCEEDTATIAALSSDAFNQHGVLTFAVGLTGSSESQMNAIAAAGGTTSAHFAGDGSTETGLREALAAIRESAIACEYLIPDAPEGETISLELLSVHVQPGAKAEEVQVPKVESTTACGDGVGWYYEGTGDAQRILLCPASCAAIQSQSDANVRVAVGCAPEVR